MRSLFYTLILSLFFYQLQAQSNKAHYRVISNTTEAELNHDDGTKTFYRLQVGNYLPLIYRTSATGGEHIGVSFPWNIRYVKNTFFNEFLTISKGWYPDKVLLEWELKAYQEQISYVKIYRRILSDSYTDDNTGFVELKKLNKDVNEYIDTQIEGGKLYEYKIKAFGIALDSDGNDDASLDERYVNYITDVGFRSPTAIVTGNINFKGGNPVKDVQVVAAPVGNEVAVGSSLRIPKLGSLKFEDISKPITDKLTFQTWFKFGTIGLDESVDLFEDNGNIKASLKVASVQNDSITSIELHVAGNVFTLADSIPTGELTNKGMDLFGPLNAMKTSFVHLTLGLQNNAIPTLHINGRPFTQMYYESQNQGWNNNTTPETNVLFNSFNSLNVGGGNTAFVDEIRIWNALLDEDDIRTDYKRYISGNHKNLVAYLRADEGKGAYAYDISRSGFVYNKNHAKLSTGTTVSKRVLWTQASNERPNTRQLGVMGITDKNGNYEISAIPYAGVGESFEITPMLGVHKFEPAQQLIYLGNGSGVVNKVNYIDKSSFKFKGRVLYDTRGVFGPIAQSGGAVENEQNTKTSPNINDEGYNTYKVDGISYEKGLWWQFDTEKLYKYPKIPVKGANVYIDNDLVFNSNNQLVTSDVEGEFTIEVPIGNHSIRVVKDGHEFKFNGRYPADTDNLGTTSEFFEDREEVYTFIDSTRVTLVGRVVGGAIEASKQIGFGHQGNFQLEEEVDGFTKTKRISSANNIGVANMILGYKPAAGNITPATQLTIMTNPSSGEYRTSLLPLQYSVENSDLKIPSNVALHNKLLGSEKETFNFEEITDLMYPELEIPQNEYVIQGAESSYTIQGDKIFGLPYNYTKSFTHRSSPTVEVVSQTKAVNIQSVIRREAKKDSIVNFEVDKDISVPFYNQKEPYHINIATFEAYENKDNLEQVEISKVAIPDANFTITNNLALEGTESFDTSRSSEGNYTYSFEGGISSISPPFTKTIKIEAEIAGITYEASNYKKEGIILGVGNSEGEPKNFTTFAPDYPDIILRDPPGSNSFASIEKGTTISVNKSSSFSHNESVNLNTKMINGVVVETGGGLGGPVFKSQTINNLEVGIGYTHSAKNTSSSKRSYTFNKTISTSNNPNYVGSDGDLYIGASKNIVYSAVNFIEISLDTPNKIDSEGNQIPMNTDEYSTFENDGQTYYISRQKALSINEEATGTFFMYSQKHILETLIPDLLVLKLNAPTEEQSTAQDTEDSPIVMTKEDYQDQIDLWYRVIFENEKDKYVVKNRWEDYIANTENQITLFKKGVNIQVENDSLSIEVLTAYANRKLEAEAVENLIDESSKENISFDAGLGSYKMVNKTAVVNSTSINVNHKWNQTIAKQFGFTFNGTGFVVNIKGAFSQEINESNATETSNTTNISYVLKDNDPNNMLNVEVFNAFNGHGPVFSTVGGRTSCPYEGATTSLFLDASVFKDYYDSFFDVNNELFDKQMRLYSLPGGLFGDEKQQLKAEISQLKDAIVDLNEQLFQDAITADSNNEKAELSAATQNVEVPLISIEDNSQSGILEGRNAEFDLILENNSLSESDATFVLKVDNVSNPNNAIINIEPNGTLVTVPYGQKVPYKLTLSKATADVFEYEDIRIVLQSQCDGAAVSDAVTVTATFVPSCTEILVKSPKTNWVFNKLAAYSYSNGEQTTNTLPIILHGFDTSFASFQKIDLQYRNANSTSWERLQTYFASQSDLENDLTLSNKKSLIDGQEIAYAFDIVGANLQDGNYEIRAVSHCSNDTEYISEICSGRVDLNAPLLFGTPLPANGILGVGEDIKLRFNEPVFYNTALTTLQIQGQTNQLQIDHSVSLHFDGASNNATISKPNIKTGDLSLEFWMLWDASNSTSNATVVSQENGLRIQIENGSLKATLGGQTIERALLANNVFNHYVFSYNEEEKSLKLIENESETEILLSSTLSFDNSNDLIFGGEGFVGNLHDVRLWKKGLNKAEAYANMYATLQGNEPALIGLWPMNEGRGNLAKDKARFKHAVLTADWDIKPKGNSYVFDGSNYLTLDKVGKAQLTSEMDATVSFWMKTATNQAATLISNGKADGSEKNSNSTFENKWSVDIDTQGLITLLSEGVAYPISQTSVADNQWHHIAFTINRHGAMNTYVDGAQIFVHAVDTIGGFLGNTIWLGAKGDNAEVNPLITNVFNGHLDEVRIWNTVRNQTQIDRDRFYEVAKESLGLIVYTQLNEPNSDGATNSNGPEYYVTGSDRVSTLENCELNGKALAYSNDSPKLKPGRNTINLQINKVINQDEMILEPVVSSWAALEGQIVDITVAGMFDSANNEQVSPVTWTAYVQKNQVSWFVDGYDEVVNFIKESGREIEFDITLLNQGGTREAFEITNVPSWLELSDYSGKIAPDGKKTITARVVNNLPIGVYNQELYLKTDFGFDQKLNLQVRSLAQEPDWTFDANNFEMSMNVIGILKVDGKISDDTFDKIVAVYDGEVRGVANLEWNQSKQQYFAFLTVYSNTSNEDIQFNIWDASVGKILEGTLDTATTVKFVPNEIRGTFSQPVYFENSSLLNQEIYLQKGWTWVSLNVEDENLNDINALTDALVLAQDDEIKTNIINLEGQAAVTRIGYLAGEFNMWDTTNMSTMATDKMYKIQLSQGQKWSLKGEAVAISSFNFSMQSGWNWLPFPIGNNVDINAALANLEATDSDVIKSQSSFAMYDAGEGKWFGPLTYFETSKGYMAYIQKAQSFSYPSYLDADNLNKTSTTSFAKALNTLEVFTTYASNMNAVVEIPFGYNAIKVYDQEGTLKGMASVQQLSSKKLSFITIYGDREEALTLKLVGASGTEISAGVVAFQSDKVLGSISEPLQLKIVNTEIAISPNPFDDKLVISIPSDSDQAVSVKLYSVTNSLVLDRIFGVKKGENSIVLEPNIASGYYILHIETSEQTEVVKIIKN